MIFLFLLLISLLFQVINLQLSSSCTIGSKCRCCENSFCFKNDTNTVKEGLLCCINENFNEEYVVSFSGLNYQEDKVNYSINCTIGCIDGKCLTENDCNISKISRSNSSICSLYEEEKRFCCGDSLLTICRNYSFSSQIECQYGCNKQDKRCYKQIERNSFCNGKETFHCIIPPEDFEQEKIDISGVSFYCNENERISWFAFCTYGCWGNDNPVAGCVEVKEYEVGAICKINESNPNSNPYCIDDYYQVSCVNGIIKDSKECENYCYLNKCETLRWWEKNLDFILDFIVSFVGIVFLFLFYCSPWCLILGCSVLILCTIRSMKNDKCSKHAQK